MYIIILRFFVWEINTFNKNKHRIYRRSSISTSQIFFFVSKNTEYMLLFCEMVRFKTHALFIWEPIQYTFVHGGA